MNLSEVDAWASEKMSVDDKERKAARTHFKRNHFQDRGMGEAYYLEYAALIYRRDNIKEVGNEIR